MVSPCSAGTRWHDSSLPVDAPASVHHLTSLPGPFLRYGAFDNSPHLMLPPSPAAASRTLALYSHGSYSPWGSKQMAERSVADKAFEDGRGSTDEVEELALPEAQARRAWVAIEQASRSERSDYQYSKRTRKRSDDVVTG